MEKEGINKQLSLFDIELPPQTKADEIFQKEQKNNILEKEEVKEKKISFARVPKSEPRRKYEKIPTVQDILKLLDKGTYRIGRHEFLADVFQCGAIAISNRFDLRQAEERKKVYLSIIKKYDKDMQQLIAEMFTQIYILLTSQVDYKFNDYLGEIYMLSETTNSKAGQFFTPYSVSKACAYMSIGEKMVNEYIEQDKILKMAEPSCGSGGMVIAAVDVLYNNYNFNYSRNLFVECSDIDARCVHMAYLQLALVGIPAVVYQRDTLTMETWQHWETPAYIMQYLRFKNFVKNS